MAKQLNKGTKNKTRLDLFIVEKELVKSRQRAKALIMAGKVFVNDMPVDKPGSLIADDAKVIVKQDDNPFVSRGGLKLEKALKTIPVSVKNLTCLDIGASTGGFTDCLLQHGAGKVYAVDVGYGQFDWSLRQNKRVVVIERTNIRHMPFEVINEKVDVVVADTSFISLKVVIPSAEKFMKKDTMVLALIKPQFEAGRQNVGKGGVVKDPEVRKQVIKDLKVFFKEKGYQINQVVPSPISGPKGNKEYIISLTFKENLK
ncbi:TlyA family RNA methyltransferase [Desulfobacula phenolica]|uniref:23S rRNA (Cytidine1920-2'-O)/16S rRNA (Cytidine1409-2'-O)-methyltransferase n=1 Tax=Desulfobacula phenolica TaxID=90732 RepID=A0A1H2K2T2_9BACT|nr:TlyA family RNA methyltransferase [Desulfobacula phenolica]SDU63007.1 23S rRNA (cytidine1920-2'-O)/16S rRNA (cytidine1409-2'-O)-methyltransferase [Desulfobacula phenolica]